MCAFVPLRTCGGGETWSEQAIVGQRSLLASGAANRLRGSKMGKSLTNGGKSPTTEPRETLICCQGDLWPVSSGERRGNYTDGSFCGAFTPPGDALSGGERPLPAALASSQGTAAHACRGQRPCILRRHRLLFPFARPATALFLGLPLATVGKGMYNTVNYCRIPVRG
jgi:hypothetical protein